MKYTINEDKTSITFDNNDNTISDMIALLQEAKNLYGDIRCDGAGVFIQKRYVINPETKGLEDVPVLIIS